MKGIFKSAAAAAIIAAGAISANSCQGGKQIYGNLDDAGNDTLAVYIYDAVTNRQVAKDTIVANDGKFSVGFKDTTMMLVYIVPLHQNSPNEPIFFMPGEKVKVSGSLSAPVYGGSAIYDGLDGFPEYKEFKDKLENLFDRAKDIAENDITGQQGLNAEYEKLMAAKDSVYAEYIKSNPNDPASGYLVAQMYTSPEKAFESYNILGSTVKESAMGEFLSTIASQYESAIIKERNKSNIQPGKTAPDFVLKDIKGNERKLSSFKGKYVLLDFWGKWCYWCMKGMPDMKKYYDKYHDRIEFVGISCRDSEEVWKKTVEEEGLKWTNLYNGDEETVLNMYAVEGFPTKILIDRNGKIVEVFVGESQELYDKLDELF